MPIILSDVFGDPNVGIFSFANDNIAILPAGLSHKKISSFRDTLGVEPCSVGIADSRLVGIYVTGNSNAILVPYITTDDELKQLRSTGVQIEILREKRTALGNIILCNDTLQRSRRDSRPSTPSQYSHSNRTNTRGPGPTLNNRRTTPCWGTGHCLKQRSPSESDHH